MATVSKSSVDALEMALSLVNDKYHGNVEFRGTGSNYHRGVIRPRTGTVLAFSLNVASSHGPGHRMTAVPPVVGGRSRRLRAACWHVWRDFLIELFKLDPDCVVRTSLATYRGREDFGAKFPDTYHRNAGSQALPQAYGSLCECES